MTAEIRSLIQWYWPRRHDHPYDRGTLRNLIDTARLQEAGKARRTQR